MGAHKFTLPLPQPLWTSAEKSALDVCRRIADEERRELLHFSASLDEVERSAGILFAFAQEALLWMQQYGYGARQVLLQIRALQDLAFEVVAVSSGSRLRAKKLQIKSSGGDPLTVCVGEFKPRHRLPDHLRDVLDPHGEFEEHLIPGIEWQHTFSGCFAICPDGKGLQRPSPPRKWCEKCRKASSSRGDRWIAELVQGWGPRTCPACGTAFMPTRPDRWRCDSCLTRHRSVRRNGCSAPPSS